MRCPLAHCRAMLRDVTDRLGRVRFVCDACERRKAGLCQRCPARVTGTIGKAKWCDACRLLMKRRATNNWSARQRTFEPDAFAARRETLRLQAWRKRGSLTPEERRARSQASGRKAGKTRAERLSPERRSEIARIAVAARNAKRRAAQ
jgi:hypothetical protein